MFCVGRIGSVLAVLGLTLVGVGCGGEWDYALGAVRGEIAFLDKAVPIERALNDPSLTDEQREKLAFVVRARDYGEHVIGLDVGDSFRKFVNLDGETLAYNLSASPKDAIEPYVWDVPIVGKLTNLGFFVRGDAIAERDRLVKRGYDTFIYEVDAFSTLGLLGDPVASPLLRRSLGSLADTVMHELLHNTVWRDNDVNYNESLATFVGRTAGLQFLTVEFGEDDPIIAETQQGYEDAERFNAFLQELTAQLTDLYATDVSRDEKIAAREAIIMAQQARFAEEVLPQFHRIDRYEWFVDQLVNNAFLLVQTRYNSDQDLFEAVYEFTGRDWSISLDLFGQAAAARQGPRTYLRGILGESD